jgi:hypothetical protein
MKKIFLLFLSFLCLACGKNVNQVAFDYLNANELYFDKKNYEFVSSELVDTLFQNEYPQSDYYLPSPDEVLNQDSTMSVEMKPWERAAVLQSENDKTSYFGLLKYTPKLPVGFTSLDSTQFNPDAYSEKLFILLLQSSLDEFGIPNKKILNLVFPYASQQIFDAEIKIIESDLNKTDVKTIVFGHFENTLKPEFRKKLLQKATFRNEVKKCIANFKNELLKENVRPTNSNDEWDKYRLLAQDNFIHQYHPDSINKYTDLELKRTQTIHGFEYLFKYRINGKLIAKKLLFNQGRDTILSSLDLEN